MMKLFTITILILVLLIPATMIKSIIVEREYLNNTAIEEVSSKWANDQCINGPVLSIPILFEKNTKEGVKEWTEYYHILPESLNINGQVTPEKLKRGIYEIVVYKSNLFVNGSFLINQNIKQQHLKEIKTNEAFLTVGISDLRGIEDDIFISWNDKIIKATPGSRIYNIIPQGVTIDLPQLVITEDKLIEFTFDLNLQGSQNLSFVPTGSTTNVSLESTWPSPSFNGQFLPDERAVSDAGFSSDWKILQLNRNFPQSWLGELPNTRLENSVFGVDLLLPLDDYQKSIRSAKYAIMTIALSFLVFFLVEILNNRKIHPFQYTLVGLSLCLFYVLLISISEHSNFNFAYIISAFAVIAMIFLYSLSVFGSKRLSMILMAILTGLFGFLFVTLQLADYALLMGSVGLTIILAGTMYFTRNINWYQLNQKTIE
ncbi:MAG: cell envelope integrity protein CreD [Reichenbachiella sp.]